MKRSLLATTALVAAGLVLSTAGAFAQSKEGPIQVGIGGYFFGYLAGQSQDSANASGQYVTAQPGANLNSVAVFRKSRLTFNGLTNLDNGVKVGFRVELRGESNSADQIDKSFLFFDTPFGIVQLGKKRGAAYDMNYSTPNVQAAAQDPWSLNFGDFTGTKTPGKNLYYAPNLYVGNNRSERIVYFTPRFAGFQAGVSYAPDGCDIANPSLNQTVSGNQNISPTVVCGGGVTNGFMNSNNVGQQSKQWDIGVNYVNKIAGIDVAASAGYVGSTVEANQLTQTGGPSAYKNEQAWNVGAQLGYAGFLFGIGYQQDNNGTNAAIAGTNIGTASANTGNSYYSGLAGNNAWIAGKNEQTFGVGLAYQYERWRVGLNYFYGSINDVNTVGAGIGKDKYQGWEIGGGYTLGPGINLTAGVEWQQWKSGVLNASNPLYNSGRNTGTTYQIGTALFF